jgi:hypothetical protein
VNKKVEEGGLGQVLKEADELLDRLDAIDSKPDSANTKKLIEKTKEEPQKIQQQSPINSTDERTQSLITSGWIIAGFVLAIFIGIAANSNTSGTQTKENIEQSKVAESSQVQEKSEQDSRPAPSPRESSQEEVYFNGINLPVTNSLCNKKGNFCIYGLARLVESESGSATYTFEDVVNNEIVSIRGDIGVSNIDKGSDGTRTFTFSFRDNQSETTQGWAAAGYFNIDQSSKQPGIMTRFKTTESFGPKTPVGLENTSYLFPR